jgi:hypothetical protein
LDQFHGLVLPAARHNVQPRRVIEAWTPAATRAPTERSTQVYFAAGHQDDATAIANALQRQHGSLYPPVTPLPKVLRGPAGTAGVAVVVGPDHFTRIPAARTTVAVLNATTAPGLARGVANRLQQLGFKIGNVTNAPDHTRATTTVEVGRGAGTRNVLRVIAALGLRSGAMLPLSRGSRAVAGPDAQIVVIVGADQNARVVGPVPTGPARP